MRSNKELTQLFGDFDILSFVRICWLNWIGHVNRMDSKRKISEVFNNNPQGSRLKGQSKNIWWNCAQTDILLLRLLLLALQPTVGFSLLSDSLPFCSFFTLLPPPSYSHCLHIFFNVFNPSLPWSSSNSRTYRSPL